MSELTSFRVDKYEVYDKDEADARIAEMEAELAERDRRLEGFRLSIVNEGDEVSETTDIARLRDVAEAWDEMAGRKNRNETQQALDRVLETRPGSVLPALALVNESQKVAKDAIALSESLAARIAELEAEHRYPHMCRDGHPEVGHSTDNERCPVCLMRDERDARYPS